MLLPLHLIGVAIRYWSKTIYSINTWINFEVNGIHLWGVNMALSKQLFASEISPECIPDPECYIRKELTLVIENLNPHGVMDYVRYCSKPAVSVDNIKAIVGGPNMEYPCIELDQAQGIYEICRNYLLQTLKSTVNAIMFFSEHVEKEAKKMMVAITNRKATKGQRGHLIFWGCLLMEINDAIPVGFARSFDMPSKYFLFKL